MEGCRLRVLGYTRVSTEEQATSGYGLDAQAQRIREWCHRCGVQLDHIHVDEGLSGRTLDRPQLHQALELIRDGKADGLVVAKLDRLSRSVMDIVALFDWFERAGGKLIALDLDLDTSTPGGKLIAHIFAALAQMEREVVSERTSAALKAMRAQGRPINQGAVADDPALAERIRWMRARGLSYRQICADLNAQQVPTLRGGAQWYPSTLQTLLGTAPRRARARRTVVLPDV